MLYSYPLHNDSNDEEEDDNVTECCTGIRQYANVVVLDM